MEVMNADSVCVNRNPATLKCTYDLNAQLNGELKYLSSEPGWRQNGQTIRLPDPRYVRKETGPTSAILAVNITQNDPVNFSCFLLTRNGSPDESNNITVKPEGNSLIYTLILPH